MSTAKTKIAKVNFFEVTNEVTEYIPKYVNYLLNAKLIKLRNTKAVNDMKKQVESWQAYIESVKSKTSKTQILEYVNNLNKCKENLENLLKKQSEDIKAFNDFEELPFSKKLASLRNDLKEITENEKAITILVKFFNENAFNTNYDLTVTNFDTFIRTYLQHKDNDMVIYDSNGKKLIGVNPITTVNIIIKALYSELIEVGKIKSIQIPEELKNDFAERVAKKQEGKRLKAEKAEKAETEKNIQNRKTNTKKKNDSMIKGK